MDITAFSGIILSALSAVQSLLPLLGAAGNTASIVTTIISMLTKVLPVLEQLAPLAGDEVSLIYQGVKSIISSLRGVDTTAEQDAALDALDKRVDDAWNAVQAQFDPDYVSPSAA